MSSWDAWINSLMAYPGVNVGAIIDRTNGSIWAQSANFTASQAELNELMKGISKQSAGEFPSFTVFNTKFMTIRLLDGEIDGKKGASSVSVMACSKCIVIGGFIGTDGASGDSLNVAGGGQQVNIAVSKIKEALLAGGF